MSNFTKKDLKTGMIVEFRDGRKAYVVNGTFIDNTTCFTTFIHYNDNLLSNLPCKKYDIMKVYDCRLISNVKYDTPIWERKEHKTIEINGIPLELSEDNVRKLKEILKDY